MKYNFDFAKAKETRIHKSDSDSGQARNYIYRHLKSLGIYRRISSEIFRFDISKEDSPTKFNEWGYSFLLSDGRRGRCFISIGPFKIYWDEQK